MLECRHSSSRQSGLKINEISTKIHYIYNFFVRKTQILPRFLKNCAVHGQDALSETKNDSKIVLPFSFCKLQYSRHFS